ncbi:hypothetical protein DFH28DRAFT_1120121 [Melampsora americana]|nr:hypothetical protein DFH28DRAFT_1120121 [Melampsora americana]
MPRSQKKSKKDQQKKGNPNTTSASSHPQTSGVAIDSTPIDTTRAFISPLSCPVTPALQGTPSPHISQADLIRLQLLAANGSPGFITIPTQVPPSFQLLESQAAPVSPMKETSTASEAQLPAKRTRGRPKKTPPVVDVDTPKGQVSWFEKREDGFSDVDIIALWCAEDDNFKRWKSHIPTKIGVAAQVADHLKEKNHPKREPREVDKKIRYLEEQFKSAYKVLNSTGQGILSNDDYKGELEKMDLISHVVNSDGEEVVVGKLSQTKKKRAPENGTALEKAIAICPWYCLLEAAMLERSNIIPEATRDTLGNQSSESFTSISNSKRNIVEVDIDDNEDSFMIGSDVEDEKQRFKSEEKEHRDVSKRPNKWGRRESRNGSASSRDTLGLQNLMQDFLPTKIERDLAAQEEQKKAKQQMNLNSKIAKAITAMSNNRKEGVQLKREQLRGEAVTRFMSMGDNFDEAFRKALVMYPQSQQHEPPQSQKASGSNVRLEDLPDIPQFDAALSEDSKSSAAPSHGSEDDYDMYMDSSSDV